MIFGSDLTTPYDIAIRKLFNHYYSVIINVVVIIIIIIILIIPDYQKCVLLFLI